MSSSKADSEAALVYVLADHAVKGWKQFLAAELFTASRWYLYAVPTTREIPKDTEIVEEDHAFELLLQSGRGRR